MKKIIGLNLITVLVLAIVITNFLPVINVANISAASRQQVSQITRSQDLPLYELFNQTNTFNLATNNPTPGNMKFDLTVRNVNSVMSAKTSTRSSQTNSLLGDLDVFSDSLSEQKQGGNLSFSADMTDYMEQDSLMHTESINSHSNASVMPTPQITVLTHGLGVGARAWSNSFPETETINGEERTIFAYCDNSIINEIRRAAGDANVYWARMTGITSMNLINITNQTGVHQDSAEFRINNITDISKHIIVVFEARQLSRTTSTGVNQLGRYGTNDNVYFEFNYMLSRIVHDVKVQNNGILPMVNLIGHSRGGITNLQYALDHPHLVASMVSIGTPFFGTTTGQLYGERLMGSSAGLNDILNPNVYRLYNQQWNGNYHQLYSNINAVAIGAYSSTTFLERAVQNDQSNFFNNPTAARAALNVLGGAVHAGAPQIASLLGPVIFEMTGKTADAQALLHIATNEFGVNFELWPPQYRAVWYTDIMVHRESQLGRINASGMSNYLGFARSSRYFHATHTNNNGTNFSAVSDAAPPIPHNLQARDRQIISRIVYNSNMSFYAIRPLEVNTYEMQVLGTEVHLIGNNTTLHVAMLASDGLTYRFSLTGHGTHTRVSSPNWNQQRMNMNYTFTTATIVFFSDRFEIFTPGFADNPRGSMSGRVIQKITIEVTQTSPNQNTIMGRTAGLTSPIPISTMQQLSDIRNHPNGRYILIADINLANTPWTPIPLLQGTFDGNGHTISNLNIQIPSTNFSSAQHFGLFGRVSGSVQNLNITNVTISSPTQHSGSFVNSGSVAGTLLAGGLICSVTVTNVTANVPRHQSRTGGIVGDAHNSTIQNCITQYSHFATHSYLGGIAGYLTNATLTNSLTQDTLIETRLAHNGERASGGLVGYCRTSTVSHSNIAFVTVRYVSHSNMNTSDVTPRMGLLIGNHNGSTLSNCHIHDSDLHNFGNLRVIRWGLFNSLSHNQAMYFGTGIHQSCGRVQGGATIVNVTRAV